MGIVTVVFKFGALCNDTPELKMDSSETKRYVYGSESRQKLIFLQDKILFFYWSSYISCNNGMENLSDDCPLV